MRRMKGGQKDDEEDEGRQGLGCVADMEKGNEK